MFKKSLLGAAIAAIAATSAAQAESFIDDSSLKVSYKNYYWNENGKSSTASERSYDRDEWVHAVVGDFESGYFADIIGFDFSAAYADEINIDEQNGSTTNLPTSSSGNADDIGTVTVAYLKGKYAFSDDVSMNGGYGKKKRGLMTYSDSGSRILNAGSYGADLSFDVFGIDLYGTQITRFSERNDSAYAENMTNAAGKKIDKINIFGAAYSFENGLALAAERAASEDYLERTVFTADYSLALQNEMSVDLNARYGSQKQEHGVNSDDNLYDGTAYSSGEGRYESNWVNLNATLNVGNASFGLGYNKTKDGDYDNALFDQDHGSFNSSLDQWEVYAFEDESAYIVSAGYDFVEVVPGLTADIWYARGSGAKNVENFGRQEISTYVNYAFSGQLEGLNIAWYHSTYRASGDAKGDRNADSIGTLYDEDVNRFYLTYTYEVF